MDASNPNYAESGTIKTNGPGHTHNHGENGHTHEHGHTHEVLDNPGKYTTRDRPVFRSDWKQDFSLNLEEVKELTQEFHPDLVIIESGGDNLAANFSRELTDYIIYVIDVAGGDKVPRKGGPGITQSDTLVINKTDLAEAVGADLKVMDRDAKLMRQDGPTIFCTAKAKHMVGVPEIASLILEARQEATQNGA
ncbi:LOW QUALITY PROTEIN: uncharacterized protein LOC123526757 [Mercenaria mercenaria]|uniref:LOW QUALITY PROTEIN: uncharacterized protein LOC123526757 n=1 Tax=Mercenaria mercenaria TaxID=6596 RepID=UPI00234EE273|nr:LOW QUALITY PROTEIN: uncharacterized protein LOC123526757 [Mercenaria mercenaria]